MSHGLSEETLFWIRLAAFANLSEYVLSTGASATDAEEFLLGYSLPASLPSRYACLAGGAANNTVFG